MVVSTKETLRLTILQLKIRSYCIFTIYYISLLILYTLNYCFWSCDRFYEILQKVLKVFPELHFGYQLGTYLSRKESQEKGSVASAGFSYYVVTISADIKIFSPVYYTTINTKLKYMCFRIYYVIMKKIIMSL